jgi:hypothetical protein
MELRTAYLMLVHKDGNVTATADLGVELEIDSEATVQDIKSGVLALAKVIERNDLVEALLAALKTEEGEEVSSSIRKALDERGIL